MQIPMKGVVFSSRPLPQNKTHILSLANTYAQYHTPTFVQKVSSDESCFGGSLITCLRQEMHFALNVLRIHNKSDHFAHAFQENESHTFEEMILLFFATRKMKLCLAKRCDRWFRMTIISHDL